MIELYHGNYYLIYHTIFPGACQVFFQFYFMNGLLKFDTVCGILKKQHVAERMFDMADETIRIPSAEPERKRKKPNFRLSTVVFIAVAIISCVGAGFCYGKSRDLQKEIEQRKNAYDALHQQAERIKTESGEKLAELQQIKDRLNDVRSEIERLS